MGEHVRKERKNYTPEEKIAILRRYLVDKVTMSQICIARLLDWLIHKRSATTLPVTKERPSPIFWRSKQKQLALGFLKGIPGLRNFSICLPGAVYAETERFSGDDTWGHSWERPQLRRERHLEYDMDRG
jgi:hypothetical protein